MEEFVPSSLKDLLTPEEQIRRMSRTSSAANNGGLAPMNIHAGVQDNRHRYSRSVPATSVLRDIKAIWAEPQPEVQQHLHYPEDQNGYSRRLPGTPSSFKSGSGLVPHLEDASVNMLSPSNASAAFLPGLHQHYLSRAPLSALRPPPQSNSLLQRGPLHHTQVDSNEFGGSPSSHLGPPSMAIGQPQYDPFTSLSSQQHSSGRPIPPSNIPAGTSDVFVSPLTKALQSHAPGQSLPQGLAAGYSRIHLQPAPSTTSSPASSSAAFSPGHPNVTVMDTAGSPDWLSVTPSKLNSALTDKLSPPTSTIISSDHGDDADGGLASMFSRLSYSAAAARGTPPSGLGYPTTGTGNHPISVPMSMSRRSSARGWNAHPLSSPLSGPVLSNDDDDLFSMDEEK